MRGSEWPARRCTSSRGDALFEQIRNGRDPEGVRGEAFRDCGILQPPFHHAAYIVYMKLHAREAFLFPHHALKYRGLFRRIVEASGVEVIENNPFEIVADGDFARLVALFFEVQHPLLPGPVENSRA